MNIDRRRSPASANDVGPGLAARSAVWVLPLTATVAWLVAMLAAGMLSRVLDHWVAALTMLFGSFLAGSSPEGGGAVAFPIFTKGLHVPSEVARSFGLCIQAVGMTMAAVSIVLLRRRIHLRAVVVASVAAVAGFLLSVAVFGQPETVFWPSSIGTPWIKATFSVVLATTALLMLLHDRHRAHHAPCPAWTNRHSVGLIGAAVAGGFLSSLTGTGANIVVFLFLVVWADVNPKVALPSAILVMAAVSLVGLVLFGLIDGQLDVDVAGDRVTSVGGDPVDLVGRETDLLGLWLAAVPIVVWGAPLGSWAAAHVSEHFLVRFIAVLAAVEVVTTFVLVSELRTDAALVIFFVTGLFVLPLVFLLVRAHRAKVFATTPP